MKIVDIIAKDDHDMFDYTYRIEVACEFEDGMKDVARLDSTIDGGTFDRLWLPVWNTLEHIEEDAMDAILATIADNGGAPVFKDCYWFRERKRLNNADD